MRINSNQLKKSNQNSKSGDVFSKVNLKSNVRFGSYFQEAFETKSLEEIQATVFEFQNLVLKYYRDKELKKVKSTISHMLNSKACKAYACLKIMTNKGAKTKGIDGYVPSSVMEWVNLAKQLNGPHKFSKNRHVEVESPKGMKPPKMRPLGIPTVRDRCEQSLILLCLEPIYEEKSSADSIGYRKLKSLFHGRTTIEFLMKHCGFNFVVEGDIKGCFSFIKHSSIMKKMDFLKGRIFKILKASGKRGTPQGGVLSPLLANAVLCEIERNYPDICVRFADDFIIFCKTYTEAMEIKKEVGLLVET